MSQKLNFRLQFITFCVFIALSIVGCKGLSGLGQSGSTPTPNPLDFVQDISIERSRAEEWAKVLKSNWDKDTPEYKQGEKLYIEAKSAIDGWIDQLKLDLIANKNPSSSEYKNSISDALEKGETFVKFVETLRNPNEASTPIPLTIIGVIGIEAVVEAFVDAVISMWEAYRDADMQRKQEIIKILDELKWKSFQEI